MKRRSFTKGLAMLAGALLIPLDVIRGEEPPRDDLELFKRFFYVANGFAPNENQMKWFVDYQRGGHENFTCGRQSGMTTFMLTLAQFEKKCNGVDVAIFNENDRQRQYCKDLIAKMEDRLGKSVKDGAIYFHYHSRFVMHLPKSTKVFVTNDGLLLHETWENLSRRQVFSFGTYEFGKTTYDAGYFYCPYIPIYTTPLT